MPKSVKIIQFNSYGSKQMILGIGTDIIEVDRIKKVFEKRGEKFLQKIFTAEELEYSRGFKNSYQHLAARFSSKEAYYKSVGEGILIFNEIEVKNEITGKPYIVVHGKTREKWESLGKPNIHLSLSHTDLAATAFVVLEKLDS